LLDGHITSTDASFALHAVDGKWDLEAKDPALAKRVRELFPDARDVTSDYY
jgi:hypothetical protein